MSEVDRMLDEALLCYTACEPRTGLAGRVLAHVEAESRTTRWAWWAWGAIVATLCCAVVVNWPRPVERMEIVQRTPAVPAEGYALTPARSVRQPVRRSRAMRPLLVIARIDEDTAHWLVATGKPLETRPVEIRPLQIEPLDRGELK